MTRGRGCKKTPERVVGLLVEAVSKSNKASVAKDLDIGVAALHRYLKGIGEPTTATLEKLGAYFGVSVAWLRGEEWESDGTILWLRPDDFADVSGLPGGIKPLLSEEGKKEPDSDCLIIRFEGVYRSVHLEQVAQTLSLLNRLFTLPEPERDYRAACIEIEKTWKNLYAMVDKRNDTDS